MSHVVLTCVCPDACPIPGHGTVPRDPVDPYDLVDASTEALGHIDEAVTALMKARAAWVSRGLDSDNQFPRSLDELAAGLVASSERLRRWAGAAKVVADRVPGGEADAAE